MSRCYICDASIERPQFDGRDGSIKPCSHCEAIIMEAAGAWATGEDEMDMVPFLDEDSTLGGTIGYATDN